MMSDQIQAAANVAAKKIESLEAEVAELRGDRQGWAARSQEQYDRIGKALDPIRLKRSTGEPSRSDASEVEDVARRYTALMKEEIPVKDATIERLRGLLRDAHKPDCRLAAALKEEEQ